MAIGGAEVLDQGRENALWLREQFLANRCDDDFIGDFAESRGITRWPHESDAFWKDRVVRAYVFYMLGGKKAGVEEIFELAGLEADIIEPRDLRDAWTASGGVLLDGTWQVDGSEKLIAPFFVSVSRELAWAEFLVQASLEDAIDPVWQSLARHIVAEFKPARSIPYWQYYLETEFNQDHDISTTGLLTGQSLVHGLNCGLHLDGSWGLGDLLRLDGTWALDGEYGIGQVIAEKTLPNCHIRTAAQMVASVEVTAHRQEGNYFVLRQGLPWFSLDTADPVKLDGSYKVGLQVTNRLDGTKQVGVPLPEGDWPYADAIGIAKMGEIYFGGSSDSLTADVVLGGDAATQPVDVIFPDTKQQYFGGTADSLPASIIAGGDAATQPGNVIFSV